jgi:metal-responsive CopG/Arc/MetJ family transcriptional regulator
MPPVRVSVPDELLKVVTARAGELGKSLDEFCGEAVERYIGATKNASAGSVRSRLVISRSSPEVVIDVPDELVQRADEAAERQEKRRPVMFADALAYYMKAVGMPAESALDQGHDLPSGAWRPTGST